MDKVKAPKAKEMDITVPMWPAASPIKLETMAQIMDVAKSSMLTSCRQSSTTKLCSKLNIKTKRG
jgi:hypothetical protein